MTIPGTLAIVHLKHFRNWLQIPIIIALSLQLAGIWFSGGRGPFVAVAVSIITLLIFTAVIGSPRKVVKTLITLVLACTIAALIVILPSPVPYSNIGWGRVASIANEFTSANDTTGSIAKSTNIEGGLAGRFNIWNSSIKLARQWDVPIEEPVLNSMLRPLFGLGPDMYCLLYTSDAADE